MGPTEFTTGQIRPIECVKEAWTLIKDEYWILFGVSIIGAMVAGISLYVLIGAMVCGILGCYLKKIDGGSVKFEDLWIGFKYLKPSLLATVLIVFPIVIWIVVMLVTLYLPIIMAAMNGNRRNDDAILGSFAVGFAIDIVVAVVMVCIHSLLIFCFPLIVDRGIGSIESIKLSARAALKNLGGIGGLMAVNFLIALAGEMAFCVGLYLIIPLVTASNVVAYRKVFPALTPGPNLFPPPPETYQTS